MVDGAAAHITAFEVSVHMHMDCVSSNNSRLTGVSKFNVFESRDGAIRGFSVKHQMSSILIFFGVFRVSLDENVSCEAADLNSHIERASIVVLYFRIMAVFKFGCEGDVIGNRVDADNGDGFSLIWVEVT